MRCGGYYKGEQRALYQLVDALTKALEARDPYTVWHQKGVSVLARCLSQYMGMNDGFINSVRLAGTLHDIGKVAIPSEILTKPTKLTEAEFNLVKAHPKIGYDILKNVNFPWPIAKAVYQHHERVDGSGYPNNLAGHEIIIEAQILGICDTVDAMIVDRPYRKKLSIDQLLNALNNGRGTAFNPELVDAMIELLSKNKEELLSMFPNTSPPVIIQTIINQRT